MNDYEPPPSGEEEEMVVMALTSFHQLMKDSFELNCLHMGGVKDWKGYEQSLEDGGFHTEYMN